MKLWAGRFSKALDESVDDFNSSISFDYKLLQEDVQGSLAHAQMLKEQNIISAQDYAEIQQGLTAIEEKIFSGELDIDFSAEDIHMFMEETLTSQIGNAGKKLHTARSRNDQVATDMKLYVIKQSQEIIVMLENLLETLCHIAQQHTETIMPGYTHLQRAQPITFAHHLMAYAQMFYRDIFKLQNAIDIAKLACPLGSGALAGTTYNIDRHMTAQLLGFDAPSENSMDGVSDRDFCLDFLHCMSLIMTHLSRFSEEIILWCSFEFHFISLDDAFATGSSIMPQKKNPDIAELVRGKSGRVFGNLFSLFTVMKGLPLAYNKDMQEDKESVFDSAENVKQCLPVFTKMLESMTVNEDAMYAAASKGFMNATDCADYLVGKGLPFRTAYQLVGQLVAYCTEKNTVLENLSIKEFQSFSNLFEEDVYKKIDLQTCVEKRTSYGGPATAKLQIEQMKEKLAKGI